MGKWRKKPIVIEAEVYREGLEDGFANLDAHSKEFAAICFEWNKRDTHRKTKVPFIQTLEGQMFIAPGDFIITGVKGERYPCKPDIIHASYEPVEEKTLNELMREPLCNTRHNMDV